MFTKIVTKIVGSKNERDLKQVAPIVQRINELESGMTGLSDMQLLPSRFPYWFRNKAFSAVLASTGLAKSM